MDFSKNIYKNGHQISEKMPNISDLQENAIQNHTEILPHTCEGSQYIKKARMWRNWNSYTTDGNLKWCSLY